MDDDSTTAALEQSLTKLFIGDVPASVTTEELRECLEKFGELDECVVKQGSGEQGTRFAFVWSDAATAAKILAQPHTIGDAVIPKPVLAKRQQRLAKDVKSLGSAPIIPDKIFVGGLSNETTVDDFRAHFAGYGTVKDAVIMLDRVTNRSRGFGFVIFVDPASVTAVLDEQQYHEIGGRKVEVKPALPKELVEKGYEGRVNTVHGSASSFMQPTYFSGEEGMPYMDQPVYMMPPGMPPALPYYAYGVEPSAITPPEVSGAMQFNKGMLRSPSKPHGVPMPPGGGAAHSFIILPHPHSAMGYSMSPPPMQMYGPMMQAGVPVGGPAPPHGPMMHGPPAGPWQYAHSGTTYY